MVKKKGTPWDPKAGAVGRKRRQIRELSDWYVKRLIAGADTELVKKIPAEMIEFKREAVLLKRLGRSLDETFKEINHES